MADIIKIDGYFIKDASARKDIANHNHDAKYAAVSHNHGSIKSDGTISGSANEIVVTGGDGTIKSAKGMTTDLTNYSLNQLTTGTSAPVDTDYFISQYAGGGTTTTTYHRRPVSALYTYMKGKMDSDYAAKSHNHSGAYAPASHTHSYISLSGSSDITGSLTPSSTTPTLGTSTKPWGTVYAYNGFVETSDANKKTVICEIDLNKAYDLIEKCSTIVYTLKDDPDLKEQIGVIAQEVQEFFPEIVETAEDGSLMLSYSRLTVILMKVMKDLISRVQKLENK